MKRRIGLVTLGLVGLGLLLLLVAVGIWILTSPALDIVSRFALAGCTLLCLAWVLYFAWISLDIKLSDVLPRFGGIA